MKIEQAIEQLKSLKTYGECYNGTVKVGEIIDLIEWQKAEIERLNKLAELRKKDNDDTCKLLFEVEKKVDELKSKNRLLGLKALTLSTENKMLIEICNDCDTVKQAEKDTAKEIIKYLKTEGSLDDMWYTVYVLQRKYGVEVE